MPKIDEKCLFPALFFPAAALPTCSCWIREAATMHYGTVYVRTYQFRRFPALNSIHPFWPTRLWEMISAVVPLNFLFLALLRIHTYDILLQLRFLRFIYDRVVNFLKMLPVYSNLSTVVTFLALRYFCSWFPDLEVAFLKSKLLTGFLNVGILIGLSSAESSFGWVLCHFYLYSSKAAFCQLIKLPSKLARSQSDGPHST